MRGNSHVPFCREAEAGDSLRPPNGNTTTSTGAVSNPFRWAGEYNDSEFGLYYLRTRYYDPRTAQFLSRDPLLSVTRSPYDYVTGNPLNHSDASGMWFGIDDAIATVGGALIGAGVSAVTQQITTGHIDLGRVGIDATAGAVGGEVALYAGLLAGGAAGGFVDDVATQTHQHHGFNNFNLGELAFDTVAGAAVGKLADSAFNSVGAFNPAT